MSKNLSIFTRKGTFNRYLLLGATLMDMSYFRVPMNPETSHPQLQNEMKTVLSVIT